jgi:CYTH domain-containing protein
MFYERMSTMATRGIEIERRFKLLICPDRLSNNSMLVSQWYLSNTGSWTIRCRITTDTIPGVGIKSTYDQTMKRDIIELPNTMTQDEFVTMRERCHKTGVHKRRFHKIVKDRLWELDDFRNPELSSLEIAEVELPSFNTPLPLPIWVGAELTGVRCFSNVSLSRFLNQEEERLEARQTVMNYLNLTRYNPATKIIDLCDPNKNIRNNQGVTRRLVDQLIRNENGHSILNSFEARWLHFDDQITVLDLTLMVAFIRRKLKKKSVK